MIARLLLVLMLLPLAPPLGAQGLPLLPAADHPAWVAVGRLNVAGFKDRSSCTGTLVAPNVVLTAAHCVTQRDRSVHAPGNVHYVAGWMRGDHVWHSPAAAIALHPDYASAQGVARVASDLAVITLARSAPAALVTPFPVAPDFPAALPRHAIIGYQYTRAAMLSARFDCPVLGPASGAQGGVLTLDCPVIPGLSGSPVLSPTAAGWQVSGVISAMSREGGRRVALAPVLDDWVVQMLDAPAPGR